MSGHTPGPWTARGPVVRTEGPSFDWVCTVQTSNVENWAANVRLISAAPDLLAALEDLADVAQALRPETVGDEMDKEARIAHAQFAIAKARGEQP